MHDRLKRFRIALCLGIMAVAVVAALAWRGISPIAALLFVLGIACLAAAVYAWVSARRIRRLLDAGHGGVADVHESPMVRKAGHEEDMRHVG